MIWELQEQCQCRIFLTPGPRVDPFPGRKGKPLTPQQRGSAGVGRSSSLLVTLAMKKSQEEKGREDGVQISPKACVRVEEKVWGQHSKSSLHECRLRKQSDTWLDPQPEKHQLFVCGHCRLCVPGRQRHQDLCYSSWTSPVNFCNHCLV